MNNAPHGRCPDCGYAFRGKNSKRCKQLKAKDVMPGERFEWRGNLYRLQFNNPNCVTAQKATEHGFRQTYTTINNNEEIVLKSACLGREDLTS